jgi:predicted DCC family thiol-disulfide oxidoreductase YuxK
MARWVRRRDRTGRVLVIANQKPGTLARFGLSSAEAQRAAWAVDRGGRRLEGAAAVNRVLREIGGPWATLAAVYRLKPAAPVEEAVYRWFARHRSWFHRLGVRPECAEPGANCE